MERRRLRGNSSGTMVLWERSPHSPQDSYPAYHRPPQPAHSRNPQPPAVPELEQESSIPGPVDDQLDEASLAKVTPAELAAIDEGLELFRGLGGTAKEGLQSEDDPNQMRARSRQKTSTVVQFGVGQSGRRPRQFSTRRPL